MDAFLWRPELGRFARMINVTKDGAIEVDGAVDASLWGLFYFGAYEASDARVQATMTACYDGLWCKTAVGGVARYPNDYYHQVSQDLTNVPGNPWFICTLWRADYLIALAQKPEELSGALEILQWVDSHKLPSGVLAEQVHPYTNAPMSVAPLTWSHATYVSTVQAYLEKLERFAEQNTPRAVAYRKLRSHELAGFGHVHDPIPAAKPSAVVPSLPVPSEPIKH